MNCPYCCTGSNMSVSRRRCLAMAASVFGGAAVRQLSQGFGGEPCQRAKCASIKRQLEFVLTAAKITTISPVSVVVSARYGTYFCWSAR